VHWQSSQFSLVWVPRHSMLHSHVPAITFFPWHAGHIVVVSCGMIVSFCCVVLINCTRQHANSGASASFLQPAGQNILAPVAVPCCILQSPGFPGISGNRTVTVPPAESHPDKVFFINLL